MGNRAVIGFKGLGTGIYLHWNGGRASVEAFLKCAKDLGVRSGEYGVARLAQIIGNWMGGVLSIGVDRLENLDCDNWDNGTYMVAGWEIVERLHHGEEEIDAEKTQEIYEECMDANYEIFMGKPRPKTQWKWFEYDGVQRLAFFKRGQTPYQVAPEAGFRAYKVEKMIGVDSIQGEMVDPEILAKYPGLA